MVRDALFVSQDGLKNDLFIDKNLMEFGLWCTVFMETLENILTNNVILGVISGTIEFHRFCACAKRSEAKLKRVMNY